MPIHDATDATRPQGLPWPILPAFLPLLYAWVAWGWWGEVRSQLDALAGTVASMNAGALAAAAVAGRIPTVLTEAALYTVWWRSRRLRLPYWRFVCWIAALSTIDLLGFSIRRAVEGAPDAMRMVGAALAGPAVLGASAEPGAGGAGSAAAFGNLGVLTLVRITMTAWAQARGIVQPIAGPLILTTVAWLITRLIGWWSVDLMKGLSPVP